jgi:transketolase
MKDIIKKIIDLAYAKKEGHIGSSLSVLDILYIIYQEKISNSIDNDRNRFILSKGHASLGLYVILNEFGLLPSGIETFCDYDSIIGGHPSDKIPYVEVSTGSLGHGLPIAVGMALGYKIQFLDGRIYVVIGDGEMNEGTIWESLLLATNHKLNNLTCIVDYNRSNDRALKLDDLMDKIRSFNWNVLQIDGHDHTQISHALAVNDISKPTFIVANTVKGHGIRMMENNPEWHHKFPSDTEYELITQELTNE